jgi:hypothetical protein
VNFAQEQREAIRQGDVEAVNSSRPNHFRCSCGSTSTNRFTNTKPTNSADTVHAVIAALERRRRRSSVRSSTAISLPGEACYLAALDDVTATIDDAPETPDNNLSIPAMPVSNNTGASANWMARATSGETTLSVFMIAGPSSFSPCRPR